MVYVKDYTGNLKRNTTGFVVMDVTGGSMGSVSVTPENEPEFFFVHSVHLCLNISLTVLFFYLFSNIEIEYNKVTIQ